MKAVIINFRKIFSPEENTDKSTTFDDHEGENPCYLLVASVQLQKEHGWVM